MFFGAALGGGRCFGALLSFALKDRDPRFERIGRIDRLRRRDEWTWLKTWLSAVSSVKPDSKLSSDSKRGQRFGVFSLRLMDRQVSDFSEYVKKVGDLLRDDALERELAQRLFKGLLLALV